MIKMVNALGMDAKAAEEKAKEIDNVIYMRVKERGSKMERIKLIYEERDEKNIQWPERAQVMEVYDLEKVLRDLEKLDGITSRLARNQGHFLRTDQKTAYDRRS